MGVREKDHVFITLSTEECSALDGLRAAQQLAHRTATDAGWYTDPKTGQPIERNFGEVVSLMHSELSEALEADRKGLMDDKLPHRDGREVEFADCIIRELDTAAASNLNVPDAMIAVLRHLATYGDLPRRLPGHDTRAVKFACSIVIMLAEAHCRALDIAGSVIEKNRFNRSRADHKLANRVIEGGKRY